MTPRRDAQESRADNAEIVPSVELKGSLAEKLAAIDAAIVRLQGLRATLGGEPSAGVPPYELHGRYINAPAWPWFTAGWVLGAMFALLFLLAWTYA